MSNSFDAGQVLPPKSSLRVPGEGEQKHVSFADGIGQTDIDPPAKKNPVKISNNEGITAGKVGKAVLRGLAGVTGGALYGSAYLGGGALAVASIPVLAVLAVPGAVIGGAVGGGLGALSKNSGALEGAKNGITKGLKVSLGVSTLPGALVYCTIGKLGAGLTAFSATGKRESTQITEKIVAAKNKPKELSTNQKLENQLIDITFFVVRKAYKAQKNPNDAVVQKNPNGRATFEGVPGNYSDDEDSSQS